jgi:hypothetical protein
MALGMIVKPDPKKPELHSDAWQRFERAIDVVTKNPPQHRKSKVKKPMSPKKKAPKKRG